jgi:hypothetical protein
MALPRLDRLLDWIKPRPDAYPDREVAMFTNRPAILLALFCFVPAFAQDDERAAEKRKEIETQRKQADELWQGLLGADRKANRKETANFLLFGTAEDKDLEAIGKGLEKAFATLKKTANLKPEAELWPGKLVVHVCKERVEFRNLYLKFKKENADKDEMGTYMHEREATIVLVGPSSQKPYPLEVEAVIQLAGAALNKKAGRLPEWFTMGFSRAAAYRHAPTHFTGERQKARLLVRQGKTAKDVWTSGNLAGDEGPILTANFIDFLINSPRTAKIWPEILENMGEETPFEDALKAAKLAPEQVDLAWRQWVR